MPLISKLIFCGAVIGFGSAFSFTNIAVSSIPPLWVAAGRSFIALVSLGAFSLILGCSIVINRALIPTYLSVGILTGVVPYILISWGQKFIPSSLGGMLFASTPLLTLLLGFIFFKTTRPTMSAILGAVTGLVGVGLAFASPTELTFWVLWGGIATIIAAASYTLGGLVVQNVGVSDIFAFSTIQLIPATIILVFIAWTGSEYEFHNATTVSSVALLCLGLFGTSIPLVCVFAFVGREGARTASLITLFIPFVALAIGVIFLSEPFSIIVFLGLIIALAGAYWITEGERRS